MASLENENEDRYFCQIQEPKSMTNAFPSESHISETFPTYQECCRLSPNFMKIPDLVSDDSDCEEENDEEEEESKTSQEAAGKLRLKETTYYVTRTTYRPVTTSTASVVDSVKRDREHMDCSCSKELLLKRICIRMTYLQEELQALQQDVVFLTKHIE
jgi:hypothetical protein